MLRCKTLLPITAFLIASCNPKAETAEHAGCPLGPGEYPVQSAAFQSDKGTYELMVLNAPACFVQPLRLQNLRLAQTEEATQKASLNYGGDENSTLSMSSDFPIKLTQTVTENGVKKEQSGSWTPFLAGAAGAVAGSLITGALMNRNKPQYYTPPPMEPGRTQVNGFGGVGDTREGATRSYQKRSAQGPRSAQAVGSTPTPAAAPAAEKKSFFRSRNAAPAASGAVRSHTPSSNRGGFFTGRRR